MTSADFDNDEDYDIVITHWPIMTLDNFKIYENLGNQDFILHNNYCETLWGNPISCELNNDDLIDIVTVGDEIKKYFNFNMYSQIDTTKKNLFSNYLFVIFILFLGWFIGKISNIGYAGIIIAAVIALSMSFKRLLFWR